ncbi:MAG: 2-hydroxyacid dehydrogenase [Hyphomicrobiales bacterium]
MAASAQTKPSVLITRKLPDDVEERASRLFDARLNPEDKLYSPEELRAAAEGFDGLFITPAEKMSAENLQKLPDSVRIIATFSVGYDHIDVPAAVARGIAVTNTPDVLTAATADIAVLLMLGAARGASWGDRMVREDQWRNWSPTYPLGYDFSGRRLGILGMGRIGQAVAKRARAFDMTIHYHGRKRLPPEQEQEAVYHATLDDMLPHCDFLSVHCASTPETRGIINAHAIGLLPADAIVVNTSRGDVVDDEALITALQSGRLAAAGLDVFRNEPDIDPRYRTLDNAFLMPHLGSATRQTRSAMGHRALDNLEAFFAGKTPGDLLEK